MKGIIIINPFTFPSSCSYQSKRMKEEFEKLGVETEIINDGFLRNSLINGNLKFDMNVDFAVYFDKDKYLSASMEKCGIRLFNTHNAIRVCDDKADTYIALSSNGINMPDTMFGALCYRPEKIYPQEFKNEIIKKIGFPMIIKECYGSLGKGTYLVKDEKEFNEVLEQVKCRPHLFQKYLSKEVGKDVRVIVIGGKVVASMERYNKNDFRSNMALGGIGTKIELSEEFVKVSEKCAKILGLDYCGVDILYGEDNKPYICEVNSNAFMDGIEATTKINVAKAYCEHIIKVMNKK